MAKTEWNDIPAPTGKNAVSRTYGVAYPTDVIDLHVRGNGGGVEYMIKMNAGDALVYSWPAGGCPVSGVPCCGAFLCANTRGFTGPHDHEALHYRLYGRFRHNRPFCDGCHSPSAPFERQIPATQAANQTGLNDRLTSRRRWAEVVKSHGCSHGR
jgi:hypothetical protein